MKPTKLQYSYKKQIGFTLQQKKGISYFRKLWCQHQSIHSTSYKRKITARMEKYKRTKKQN